ncbi:phasin family protein [Paucimonas lemoignei]|uniref:Phasin family protein n=1 Tax=Paucimonas lemoignei TaxID=29443 RepID=A0A4R3I098_PAULE|nr:TIGR01841 family phasin [Paucimonas lemoignei]TCS38594.1 phasin family protein [Paucimonas lemoignei]
MFSKRDHFSDASQGCMETQVDLHTAMGHKLLEGAQRFADLNARVAQRSLHETEEMLRVGLWANSAQDFADMATNQAKATSRKAASYACNVAGIAVGTQSELIGLLGVQITETNTEVVELMADVSRSNPGAYGRLIPMMRLSFDHANAGFERVTHASRQVLDTLETNFIAAARQFDQSFRSVARAG